MAKDFYNVFLGIVSYTNLKCIHDSDKINEFFSDNWHNYKIFDGLGSSNEVVEKTYKYMKNQNLITLDEATKICYVKPECQTHFNDKIRREFSDAELTELEDISKKFKETFARSSIEARI
jgi:hypothetical protein